MKKRAIIAIIITILIMLFTNKFWLSIKPIPVSFNIFGNGNVRVAIQLNNKNNDNFENAITRYKEIDLNKTNQVNFYVTQISYPKKFQIKITKYDNNSAPITIKNIQFRYGKYKFNEMNNYVVKDAKSEIKNSSLIIYPKDETIYVAYSDKIKVKASKKFNFEIFIILLVLSFLLVYKASNYAADFSTIKHKSRIDIIFLTIFFLFLFIPMSHINQDKISKSENRTLAPREPFIKKNGEINFNFGKDYEKWFNDRFYGRNILIKLDASIKAKCNYFYIKDNFIWNKKNNWMGCKNLLNAEHNKPFKKESLEKAVQNVSRIKQLCDKNKIKLYILISPMKEDIYSREILGRTRDFSTHGKNLQMKEYIKEKTGVNVIYVYNELKKLSETDFVFFKTDHHWTDKGAYKAYLTLMNEIKKDYPRIYINKENDFNYYSSNKVRVTPNYFFVGRTYESLSLDNENIFDVEYKYFKHKNHDDIKIKITKEKTGTTIREYNYNKRTYPNLYFYGDSFVLNLLQMLPFSFNKTKNIYIPVGYETSNLSLYESDIADYKPDILVLCFQNIANLGMIYKDIK